MKATILHSACVLFFGFFSFICHAQQDTLITVSSDSLVLQTTETTTSVPFASETISLRKPKSGTLAMVLSAVLPGAGQLYAERYYTIPLIWGFGAFFYSQYNQANAYYKDFRSRYEVSVKNDTLTHTGNAYFKEVRDYYHDKRDEFLIYLTLTYLLNVLDAYVGATLYDFDISPQLNGGVTLRYRIPLR